MKLFICLSLLLVTSAALAAKWDSQVGAKANFPFPRVSGRSCDERAEPA